MGTTTPNAWRDETVRSGTNTLLRFENCSSSHCLLFLWRQFHVFESSHASFHRTVFFGAPLAFLPCSVAGLMPSLRHFTSSCRRVFLSSTALRTWQVLDEWGHMLYRLYLHKLYLPFFALYLVVLLPCYLVTLLLCYLVIPFPCYYVTSLL